MPSAKPASAALPTAIASRVKARIEAHEGRRLVPYRDSLGIWTVGVGRNLEATGFTDAEVDLMFATDYARAEAGAATLGAWADLDDVRRGVLVEMVFQMGAAGVAKFRQFLAALGRKDWTGAAAAMLESRWAEQTPARAKALAKIIETGQG